ncbi:MAG: diacylglycerol kinase [Pseudomonadales bacterium]
MTEQERNKPTSDNLHHVAQASNFSMRGLRAAWNNEFAFRLEVCLALICLPAALWLGQTGLERGLLIMCAMLVLIVELLNSALESTVDRIGTERHELSGQAKDMGSAAVFVSLMIFVVVWSCVAAGRFL